MKLIIEIPDKVYKTVLDGSYCGSLYEELLASTPIDKGDGDAISRNAVIRMFNTMDRYRADKLILQDTDEEFPKNEVFIVDDCYELLDRIDNAPTVEPICPYLSDNEVKQPCLNSPCERPKGDKK